MSVNKLAPVAMMISIRKDFIRWMNFPVFLNNLNVIIALKKMPAPYRRWPDMVLSNCLFRTGSGQRISFFCPAG